MADPENIGVAVEIALLASLGAEIYAFHGLGRHLGFSTSGFLPVYSYGIDSIPLVWPTPEDICIAVGIALLSSVETEIIVLPYPIPV